MNRRSIVTVLVLTMAATVVLTTACGGLPGDAVAKVGDVYIKSAEYSSRVESTASQYGVTKEANAAAYKEIAASVLESLIAAQVAVQKAESLGLSVTEAELQTEYDNFVTDYFAGDQAALETALQGESMTKDGLLQQMSDGLLAGKVHDKVTKDAPAPTDAEIAAYYDTNKADYQTQQTVDARHILVAVSGSFVRGGTTTTTQATTTTTEATTASSDSTTAPSLTTTTGYSDLAWARALATAANVRAELLAGGSWSRLAAEYSDDKQTSGKGGSLGVVAQGDLVDAFGQEFDDALSALELNQISEPVKTAYGYEIIQVTKINEARQMTLEEAKADIADTLLYEAQTVLWNDWLEQAKIDLNVVYRSDLKPAPTTTTAAPTTTVAAPAATTTTAKP